MIQFRAVDEEERILEGVASTISVDDHGTVLEPRGARYTLPMPLLWMHKQDSPVGEVTSVRVSDSEIRVRVQIRKITEPGPFQELTDRAWQGAKHGLVRGFSVGFLPVKGGTKGNRFTDWKWKELSLVTLPSNEEATIQNIRSSAVHGAIPPEASGSNRTNANPNRGTKMTIQEQITQHENSRAAKLAQRQSVFDRCGEEGRTPSESERENLETLSQEVVSHDEYLRELYVQRTANLQAATAVAGTSTAAASASRGGGEPAVQARTAAPIVRVKPNTEPGIGMARYAMALLTCQGNRFEAAEYAKRTWGDQSGEVTLALQQRAAVAAGTTTNAAFAGALVQTNFISEFLELLRPMTIIGRIQNLRHVPFNTSMPAQTAGGTYKWVGQGKPKPLTNIQLATVTLGMAKASGIIVLTEELVRSSAPSAEQVVRDEMLAGIRQFLDGQFVDPAVAAVANVNPASITNGVAGTAASGVTEAAARADIRARVAAFAAANLGLKGLVILMNESVAFTLGTMVNAVGAPAFPGLGVTGGNILGIPVITSELVGTQIIFAHAPSILMADEGGVEIDVSREASLQMDSAPTDPVDATTVMVSLWQHNLVGLRAERFINWGKARATAVDRIHTVAYA